MSVLLAVVRDRTGVLQAVVSEVRFALRSDRLAAGVSGRAASVAVEGVGPARGAQPASTVAGASGVIGSRGGSRGRSRGDPGSGIVHERFGRRVLTPGVIRGVRATGNRFLRCDGGSRRLRTGLGRGLRGARTGFRRPIKRTFALLSRAGCGPVHPIGRTPGPSAVGTLGATAVVRVHPAPIPRRPTLGHPQG